MYGRLFNCEINCVDIFFVNVDACLHLAGGGIHPIDYSCMPLINAHHMILTSQIRCCIMRGLQRVQRVLRRRNQKHPTMRNAGTLRSSPETRGQQKGTKARSLAILGYCVRPLNQLGQLSIRAYGER